MEFIEAPAFARRVSDYLSDDDFRDMQAKLGAHPDLGDLSDARRGKGRRGGLRIIYYHFRSDSQVWLMTLYDKDEASDLTAKEKRVLRVSLENELKARRKP